MSAIDFPDTENDQGPVGQAAAPRSLIAIWLVALGLVLLLVPLSSLGGLFEQDNAGLANQVAAAQTLAAMTPTLAPTEQAAQQRAAHLEQAINVVAPAQSTLAASSNDVPGIVKVIGGYDANELALTSLTQTDNRLVITGRASNASAVMAYARTLKNSGQFSRVVVQSISSASTPFVPPHSEADASQTPQPIFLGQPLKLTFNPDQHKDVVTFLAKANRFYEVSTTGLAPGVDTVVTVTVKGAAYTNDDSKPGTLASALTFKAPVQDTEATIEVTNRGSFGSDKTYQLQVKEFVPTPAPGQSTSIVHSSGLINPTVAPTPTPQATATEMPASTPTSNPPVVPSPTSTVAPTATPTLTATQTSTPTPDLRDAYEPDDATPTAIGVGQTQTRSFYPQGDVDTLTFNTKSGHMYAVTTSALAPGVNTNLKVTFNGVSFQNDDYSPLETGDFASGVCFPADSAGSATVVVANLGQFGPDNTYDIKVADVPQLQVSTDRLTFGPVAAGDAKPPGQPVSLTGAAGTTWVAASDSPWLSLSNSSGTLPATISIQADSSALAAGSYQGHIILSWAKTCRQSIDVTLEINTPASPYSSQTTGQVQLVAWNWGQASPPIWFKDSSSAMPISGGSAAVQADDPTSVEFSILVEMKSNRP